MIIVDKTITLSLRSEAQRRLSAEKEIKKLGIKTDFFLTNPDSNGNAVKGCFTSHVAIAKFALEKKLHSIMIFEDDCKNFILFIQNQIDD
ncbi:MAG: hypothetical protein LRY67_01345, partial [Gammaproteobacteria bacterium]|nr:hypothetical protein [Gammaproteobacteria bacterium]